MTEERVIRKYANRRLYDAAESRHVTLEDIRRMIGAGERVKVVDDKTGEDVTRSMLLQIIASQEQFGTPVLSTQLLEAIVRFYGNPVQEMLTRYLEQSVGSLLRQQDVMRTEMAKVLESPLAPMADMARQNMELWAKMQASMLSTFTPTANAPTGSAEQSPGTAEQPRSTAEQSRGTTGQSRKKTRARKRRG
jgi:polyhydroxyalkanoate synthesis repressor PhaR